MTDDAYALMARDHERAYCWACGRGPEFRDRPDWWGARWLLHRAHIVSAPRVEDRRAVVLLCPACHGVNHGERYPQMPKGLKLTRSNLLWLKRRFDRPFYSRAFLAAHHVGALPRAVQPARWFRDQYQRRRAR